MNHCVCIDVIYCFLLASFDFTHRFDNLQKLYSHRYWRGARLLNAFCGGGIYIISTSGRRSRALFMKNNHAIS